jgi:hypothetical protein
MVLERTNLCTNKQQNFELQIAGQEMKSYNFLSQISKPVLKTQGGLHTKPTVSMWLIYCLHTHTNTIKLLVCENVGEGSFHSLSA